MESEIELNLMGVILMLWELTKCSSIIERNGMGRKTCSVLLTGNVCTSKRRSIDGLHSCTDEGSPVSMGFDPCYPRFDIGRTGEC